jgi:hypothetical protein
LWDGGSTGGPEGFPQKREPDREVVGKTFPSDTAADRKICGVVRDADAWRKKGVGSEGRRDEDPVQARGAGMRRSGVSSVVEVGVGIVGDLGEAEADFKIFPNFSKLCRRESGVGTRCVVGRLHEI